MSNNGTSPWSIRTVVVQLTSTSSAGCCSLVDYVKNCFIIILNFTFFIFECWVESSESSRVESSRVESSRVESSRVESTSSSLSRAVIQFFSN
jgi:hypothetical protein